MVISVGWGICLVIHRGPFFCYSVLCIVVVVVRGHLYSLPKRSFLYHGWGGLVPYSVVLGFPGISC